MDTSQGNASATPQAIAVPNVKNQTTPLPTPATTPAPAPTNAQGLTPAQTNTVAGQAVTPQQTIDAAKANPGTLVQGPTTGVANPAPGALPPVQTNFQAYASTPTANQNTTVTPNTWTQEKQDAQDAAQKNLEETRRAQGLDPTTGSKILSFFNNATGQWQSTPPAPNISSIFSPADSSLVKDGINPSDSGVLTTDSFNLSKATLQNAINNASSNSLDTILAPVDQYATSLIQQSMDEYKRYSTMAADPSTDPIARIYFQKQAMIESQYQDSAKQIAANTEEQVKQQEKTNKQLEGQARAAANAAGMVGSMIGEGYIAAQIQNNQDALNAIKNNEQQLLTQAKQALQNGELDIAAGLAQQMQTNRDKAQQISMQTYGLFQDMDQRKQQRQQIANQNRLTEMQLRSQGRTNLNDFLSTYSSQNMSPDSIPDTVWQQGVIESGGTMSIDNVKSTYSMLQKNQAIVDAKNESDKLKSINDYNESVMKTAAFLPPDTKLSMKMPDGSSVSFLAKNIPRTDLKQTAVETADGKHLVTTDATGKIINDERIGDNYVAPHYDSDTGKWVAFNPQSGEERIIQDNGEYGEGATALKDAPKILDTFSSMFGKPTQGEGGSFSHSNLTAYDFNAPMGSKFESPIKNGVVVASGQSDDHLSSISHSMRDFGNYVDIMNADTGYVMRFAHLKENPYKKGDGINEKSTFTTGNSGFGTNPHIHVEFRTAEDKAIKPNHKAVDDNNPIKGGTDNFDSPKPQKVDSYRLNNFETETGQTYDPSRKSSVKAFAQWQAGEQKQQDTRRKEIESSIQKPEEIKGFNERKNAYTKILQSIKALQSGGTTTGIPDNELAMSFVQLMHPNAKSVIRGQEQVRLEETAGISDQLKLQLSRLFGGQVSQLSPDQRKDMLKMAASHFADYRNNATEQIKNAVNSAVIDGIDPQTLYLPMKPKSIVYTDSSGNKANYYDLINSMNPDQLSDAVRRGEINIDISL